MKPILPTADEIPAIKAGNADLINKYYFANYALICRKAKFYAMSFGCRQDYMDFAHDVYINFTMLDFSRDVWFYTTLKRSFYWTRCGGKTSANQLERSNAIQKELYNLDAPIKNAPKDYRDMTIGEAVEADFDMLREIERPQDISQPLFDYLLSLCSDKHKPVFDLCYWFNMSYAEIGENLGISKSSVVSAYKSCLNRFRSHSVELYDFLEGLGCSVA